MPKTNNTRLIFVVDDEHVIASSLALILRYQGFNVDSFTDPYKVLQALETSVPDLLITDVVMPGFSGIELAIKIRESHPDCKEILFSGQTTTSELLKAASANGHDFEILAKPVHPTDLLARVRVNLGLETSPDQK